MNDRELLELAAKAAGYKLNAFLMENRAIACPDAIALALSDPWNNWWNPLTDDGDALRLLVNVSSRGHGLRLTLPEVNDGWAVIDNYTSDFKIRCYHDDPNVATRLVIVMAVAEIGKAMP